jgi:hypothetical protein
MIDFPPSALSLAGFVLAHAAWNVSDTAEDERLCPLAIVEEVGGGRRLLRFEADTQESAIESGKATMREAAASSAAWAFARESAWRRADMTEQQDVLTVDFWARGMASEATLLQPFERSKSGGEFRLLGDPALVVDGRMASGSEAARSLQAIEGGVMTHPAVADLWAS